MFFLSIWGCRGGRFSSIWGRLKGQVGAAKRPDFDQFGAAKKVNFGQFGQQTTINKKGGQKYGHQDGQTTGEGTLQSEHEYAYVSFECMRKASL